MISIPKIDYEPYDLRALKMVRADPKKPRKITSINVDGKSYISTERFLTSFCAVYGISPSIFTYFPPDEVVNRIVEVKGASGDRVRLATEPGTGKALAVSLPSKPLLHASEVDLIFSGRPEPAVNVAYGDGVITGWFEPKIGSSLFNIKGDDFANKFVVEVPIDGYGLPCSYLSLLRIICSNLAIGYAKAFRSTVQLGRKVEDAVPTMNRFIDSFNNEEGYIAMRQRFESATQSPASLDELFSLHTLLGKDAMQSLHINDGGGEVAQADSIITSRLRKLCGSMEIYGLVSFDSISQKKRRSIPTSGTIYDLMNFVTELATHKANTEQSRKLHAWIGTLLSSEFDLEGVLDNNEQPQDLFLKDTEIRMDADVSRN
jgi:hypothetical protein